MSFRPLILAALLAGLIAAFPRPAEALRVAAAASMRHALPPIIRLFKQAPDGTAVQTSYASSGTLSRQIRAGAPFDMFLSADEVFANGLTQAGLTQSPGKVYARGRLALIVLDASAIPADPTLATIRPALATGRLARFAIASPDHAPYGRAARRALDALGLWPALKDRLVVGENISQAAQFVLGGAAQAGLVSRSLARTEAAKRRTRHAVLADDLHPPLNHRVVILRGAPPAARRFYEFLATAPARTILADHGFDLPGD